MDQILTLKLYLEWDSSSKQHHQLLCLRFFANCLILLLDQYDPTAEEDAHGRCEEGVKKSGPHMCCFIVISIFVFTVPL
jgi:hypothetical protein